MATEYVSIVSKEEKELYTALAKFQGEIKTVEKSKTVTVQMKSGGSYNYSYADLACIWDAIRGPLSQNGLSILQVITGNQLDTILCHELGGTVKSTMTLNCAGNDIKAMGAAITYYRRYALSALVGIVSDEDVDSIESEHADGAYQKAIGQDKVSHIFAILNGKDSMKKSLIQHYGSIEQIPDDEFQQVCQSIANFKGPKPRQEKETTEVETEAQKKIAKFLKKHIQHQPDLSVYIKHLSDTHKVPIESVLIKAIDNEGIFMETFEDFMAKK